MQLVVNKEYINGFGVKIKIVAEDIPDVWGRVFIDSAGMSYYENGEYYYGNNQYSLVLEVGEAS